GTAFACALRFNLGENRARIMKRLVNLISMMVCASAVLVALPQRSAPAPDMPKAPTGAAMNATGTAGPQTPRTAGGAATNHIRSEGLQLTNEDAREIVRR